MRIGSPWAGDTGAGTLSLVADVSTVGTAAEANVVTVQSRRQPQVKEMLFFLSSVGGL